MNKYEQGKLYKITDIGYTKCYIGSTCDRLLSQRMARHEEQFKRYSQGKANWSSSFNLFEEFGIENCKIELIEEYTCENRHQLSKRAQFGDWYLKMNNERYYNNREEIVQKQAETTECGCGSTLRKSDLQRHYRTNINNTYKHVPINNIIQQ